MDAGKGKSSDFRLSQALAYVLNLGGTDNFLSDPGFGSIDSTVHALDNPGLGSGEPFNVQFGLKITFWFVDDRRFSVSLSSQASGTALSLRPVPSSGRDSR
jgi:hypothetical protein